MTNDSDNPDNDRVWKRRTGADRINGNRSNKRRGRPVISKDLLVLRREIVAGLSARGLTPGQIAKRLLSDADFKSMLEGYNVPLYRVIQTDLEYHKKGLTKRMVDGKVADGALAEYVDRQDAIFQQTWAILESRKDDLSPDKVEILLNKIQEAATNKAKALGVNVEGEIEADRPGSIGTQNNLLFADASTFMQFMKQVKEAERLNGPAHGTIEGEVVSRDPVPTS